jgi:hypothetical protein
VSAGALGAALPACGLEWPRGVKASPPAARQPALAFGPLRAIDAVPRAA